ncbi:Smr/MutS family protein [Sphingomonas sp. SM33]|uniref:Smr/MutS family protein n=1 Tax=Sphingomonas telluris TaxID=2907998 RepID=A0ABS9VKA3_9SPHN|nr:Smr/MutS family protein [Sphingomonas telluris]
MARSLSPDEAQLWARVTATIRPLSREPEKIPELEGPTAVQRPTVAVRLTTSPVRRAPLAPPVPARPGTTLDGTWDRKLRSGAIQPDRVVDLHGMTLDRAWSAIDAALERASDAGDRVILLVTGHHRPGEPPIQRGRIRAAVHDWLAVSRHASKIAAVRGAHPRHGGGGSLYIVLRRR